MTKVMNNYCDSKLIKIVAATCNLIAYILCDLSTAIKTCLKLHRNVLNWFKVLCDKYPVMLNKQGLYYLINSFFDHDGCMYRIENVRVSKIHYWKIFISLRVCLDKTNQP